MPFIAFFVCMILLMSSVFANAEKDGEHFLDFDKNNEKL